jgi:hypothetical protein
MTRLPLDYHALGAWVADACRTGLPGQVGRSGHPAADQGTPHPLAARRRGPAVQTTSCGAAEGGHQPPTWRRPGLSTPDWAWEAGSGPGAGYAYL